MVAVVGGGEGGSEGEDFKESKSQQHMGHIRLVITNVPCAIFFTKLRL